MQNKVLQDCISVAKKSRIDILKMTSQKKVGFIGSAFSCVDIISVLYHGYVDNDNILILSKGHAASAWYAVMANVGIIPHEKLQEFNENGYEMGPHPKRNAFQHIQASTGSLGQGLGLGCGCALANKIEGNDAKTYVILGDGECNEGSVWESFMFAARYNLNNLIVFIDRNRLQSYGTDREVMNLDNLEMKCEDFKWNVISIDGNNHREIVNGLTKALNERNKPTVILANTIKGKGVNEFENGLVWHYKWPEGESYDKAMEELNQ